MGKKKWSWGRSRSFVSWEDFHNEMFKVKETPMTQYISYMLDYILEEIRNQIITVLIERIIKVLVFCICG